MSNDVLKYQLELIAAERVRKTYFNSVVAAVQNAKNAETLADVRTSLDSVDEQLAKLGDTLGPLRLTPMPALAADAQYSQMIMRIEKMGDDQ